MKGFLERFATGRVVLGLFVPCTLVYLWIILVSIPAVVVEAPDTKLFDMSPAGYSYEEARFVLERIGESGRDTYLYHQLPVDTVYPGLFAVTYALMLFWVFGKFASKGSVWFRLTYLPIAAGVLDYFENMGILTMLVSYPDLTPAIVQMTSIFTILKSLFTTLFYFTLLVGLACWGATARRLKERRV